MESWITAVGLGVAAFASTNVDDIFVLVLFFSARGFSPIQVVVGQFLGIGALTGASLILSLFAREVPARVIGLLGLLPLGLGFKALWQQIHTPQKNEESALPHPKSGRTAILTVAAVTLANGGDNIGVYTPLFTTQSPESAATITVVFTLMTAIWCGLGYYLANHPRLRDTINLYGHKVFPWVLMGLGGYILAGFYL